MALTQRKRKVIEALKLTHGIVTDACISSKVSRKTYYNWRKADPEFKKQSDEAQETAIDFVQGKLFSSIESGNIAAIIFWLKCKGGYQEKLDQKLSGSLQLEITKTVLKTPAEESDK